jgi:RHS repeat-associated protein
MQSFTSPSGNVSTFGYDSSYDQTSMTYPDGSVQQATYDSHGNRLTVTNRRGHTTSFTYDAHNQLLSKTYAGGAQVFYTYDSHRNPQSVTTSAGTTTYTYDSADRLTGVAYPNGQSIRYFYNSGGQRTSMTDSTGFTINYTYDAAGRPAQLTSSGSRIVAYTYGAAGQLTRKDFGNGTYTTFAYDAAGRILHLINYAPAGSIISEYDYTYDGMGRPSNVNSPSGAWTYGYDADGQLTSVNMPSGAVQYTYDADGNRIASTSGSATSFLVDNLDEDTTVGGTSYRYDGDGNLISGGGWTYTYDDDSRLIGAASATDTWAYQYDGLGNRIAATHNGTATQYLNDPSGMGNILAEFDSTGHLIAHYTYGVDLVSSIPAGGTAVYYHFDGSGNTTQMTNTSGAVVNSYSYLPFGEKLTASAGASNPFTYVGQYGVTDEGSGLYYMRKRWYHPTLGRFIQTDPIGMASDFSLYRYAANNPLTSIDPGGADWQPNPMVSPYCTCFVFSPWLPSGFQPDKFLDELSSATNNVIIPALAKASDSAPAHVLNGAGGFLQGGWSVAGGVVSETLTVASLANNIKQRDPWGITHDTAMAITGALSFYPVTPTPFGALVFVSKFAGAWDEFTNFYADKVWDVVLAGCRSCIVKAGPRGITVPVVHSVDPNGKLTVGFGNQGFIPPNVPISYNVYFENQPSASAPAQKVVVTDPLSANLDWSTVQLNQIGFNNVTINVPAGLQSYTGQVNVSTDPNPVKVSASLNTNTGVLTWTMQSVDPATGGTPQNPLAGFLPPNTSTNQGTGFVTYTVSPKIGLGDGAVISNQASIVFDVNSPIATNTVTNTIDNTTPISSVSALPGTTFSTSFTVSWTGSDPNGSGIAGYNIFVSIDGGPYATWMSGTTQTSAAYAGAIGHSYSFYSLAVNNVGSVQTTAGPAQTTTLALPPACNISGDAMASISDVQSIINQALGASAAVSDLNHDGTVNVTDVEIVVNAALGLGCLVQ